MRKRPPGGRAFAAGDGGPASAVASMNARRFAGRKSPPHGAEVVLWARRAGTLRRPPVGIDETAGVLKIGQEARSLFRSGAGFA